MRNYKFRGKRIDNGEWVYGNLIETFNRSYILEKEFEVEFLEPEYNDNAMGCGLEDRNITDRYEAMFHGWVKAIEKIYENLPEYIEVDPETVGQFTGLNDKNNKEIYEGNKVRFHYFYGGIGEGLGFVEHEAELTGIVKWGIYGWGLEAIQGEHWQGYTGYNIGEGRANFIELMTMNESSIHEESFEIIGNS